MIETFYLIVKQIRSVFVKMKVIKIKKLKDKDILKNLIEEISDFNSGNWILPTGESYIVIDNGKIIPCYLSVKGDEALTLWVSPNYRGKGYAKFLVQSLNIKYSTALPSSLPFWLSLNFKEISPYKLYRRNKN